nr:nitroreductase/quinone reductase family protein [Streptomyces sp. HNM0574]
MARLGRTGVFRRLGPRVLPRVDLACHRWTGGRWMPSGAAVPTLVLDTVDSGGVTRSTPLLTVREPGGGFLVMGTNFGRARHPAWSQRLLRTPAATVHWRGRRIPVRARRLGEAELRAAHGRITRAMPVFDAYVRHSGREVRVFRLTPSWRDGR